MRYQRRAMSGFTIQIMGGVGTTQTGVGTAVGADTSSGCHGVARLNTPDNIAAVTAAAFEHIDKRQCPLTQTEQCLVIFVDPLRLS